MKYLLLILMFFTLPLHAEPSWVWSHEGGSKINQKDLKYTIDEVIDTLPVDDAFKILIYETLVVETRAGAFPYDAAAKNWRNYGIAQIRADTAEWLMDYLYKTNRDFFSEVYKYYDAEQSMEQNLYSNVPFSIAVCAMLYNHRIKTDSLDTVRDRAIAWKKYYNTPRGVGTVNGYVSRIHEFNRS